MAARTSTSWVSDPGFAWYMRSQRLYTRSVMTVGSVVNFVAAT